MLKKILPIIGLLTLGIMLSNTTAQADYKPPFTWGFIDAQVRCTQVGEYAGPPYNFIMLSNTFSYCSNDVTLEGLYQMALANVYTYANSNCVGTASVLNGVALGAYGSQAVAESVKQNVASNAQLVKDMYVSMATYSSNCR